MATLSHFVNRLLLLPIALLSLTLFIQLVHAQTPFTPIPAGESGSIFIEGKAFYIQSGSTTTGVTQQTFSISLSSSWNISKPAYTKLKDGLNDFRFPNTLLDDGISWFAVSNKIWFTYNLNTGEITQRAPLNTYSNLIGLSAVLDRGSGEVVIPNGNINGVQTTTLYITPFNLSSRADSLPVLPVGLSRYSLAWSESTKKTILFGGAATTFGYSAALFQRDSSTGKAWTPITAAGGPTARESACMVPAFNGAKMILFGGSSPLSSPLSDIFMYDVAAGSWTPGADGGAGRARSAHACAVSGDAFIAWGGYSNIGTRTPPAEVIAIYNLTTNKWVSTYNPPIPKQVPTSTSTPTSLKPTSTTNSGSGSSPGPGSESGNGNGPETTSPPSGSGNNIGAIVGGSTAALIVLAGLGFIIWRRDRQKKRRTFVDAHDHQSKEGSPNYKEPTERSRDPHAGPTVQPDSQSANDAHHPQVDKPQEQHGYGTETRPAYVLHHPHTKMPEDQYQYDAEMQSTYGLRHPHSEIPQKHAAEMQPAYGVHPKPEVLHYGHGHRQQRNEGYYDFKDPVAKHNNPHGDVNAQPAPQIPPRPPKGVRHPQLNISQRERELIAEYEMLQMDRGNTPAFAQPTDRWSVDRSGGATYHG
ncbi:hypothetical protein BG005_007164 [Podila minutissima]|nr:hypothetical protein BG005_007164 [Podila minutissima]